LPGKVCRSTSRKRKKKTHWEVAVIGSVVKGGGSFFETPRTKCLVDWNSCTKGGGRKRVTDSVLVTVVFTLARR